MNPAPPVINTRIESLRTRPSSGCNQAAGGGNAQDGLGGALSGLAIRFDPIVPQKRTPGALPSACETPHHTGFAAAQARCPLRPTPAITPASTNGERLFGRPITSDGTPSTAASSATVELTVMIAWLARISGASGAEGGQHRHALASSDLQGVNVGRFCRVRLDREVQVGNCRCRIEEARQQVTRLSILGYEGIRVSPSAAPYACARAFDRFRRQQSRRCLRAHRGADCP